MTGLFCLLTREYWFLHDFLAVGFTVSFVFSLMTLLVLKKNNQKGQTEFEAILTIGAIVQLLCYSDSSLWCGSEETNTFRAWDKSHTACYSPVTINVTEKSLNGIHYLENSWMRLSQQTQCLRWKVGNHWTLSPPQKGHHSD